MQKILWMGCFFQAIIFLSPACAEMPGLESQVAELSRQVARLTTLVEEQQKEIAALKSNGPVPPRESASLAAPRPVSAKILPEIGVVADTVLALDSPKEDAEGADRISVRELEITFGSAVDPYSRFDATLGISDFENMQIEEAYLTRYELPLGITARIGRFLPLIGKAIPVHRDSLDTVDEPMVIEKYFGHHGYNKTGIDLKRSLDLPTPLTHQLTVGVLEGGNGEEGTLFGNARRHPTLYTNLKNYLDLSDNTGLELGVSHLAGSRDDDSTFEVNVIGFDQTLIHRYADQRHLKIQGEQFLVNRSESFYELTDEVTGEVTEQDLDDARHLWGGYFLADWRFHPQWATGLRYDNVQLIETVDNFANASQTERGVTGYLTFYQSEFARWRFQYSHIDTTDDTDDNRLFVQGVFAIGEHKHKIQ